MSASPVCGSLLLSPSVTARLFGLCVLTVDLVFESIDLQRSCRSREAPCFSGPWFRVWLYEYFSVFEGGQAWATLHIYNPSPLYFFREKRNLF